MDLMLDVITTVLFALGGVLVFTGGLGALRMPDVYTRVHPAGLTDTMGTMLILGGLLLQAGFSLPGFKLLAILVFLLLTSPTSAYALTNAARLANIAPLRVGHGNDPEAPQ